MKIDYRIDLWCICKDEATMNIIATFLITKMRDEKLKGNILSGNVGTHITETPETRTINEGI